MGKILLTGGLLMAIVTACTSSTVTSTAANRDTTTSERTASTTTLTTVGTTTTSSAPIPTAPPRIDPTYYSLQETLECDPESDRAAVQVVQAFFTAYNQQDLGRIEELVSPDLNEIWDPSALTHTDRVLNTDIVDWATAGWQLNDRFELLWVVDYGPQAGSDVVLIRRNDAAEAMGSPGLVVGYKVPSSECTIERLVGHLIPHAIANCTYFDSYAEELRSELSVDWEPPSICGP